MSRTETLSVELSEETVAQIRESVEAGEYGSSAEAVRDALEAWQAERTVRGWSAEELQYLVQKGLESGPSVAGEPAMSALIRKYRDISEQRDRGV